MNKLVLLFWVGIFSFASCRKEEMELPMNQGNSSDESVEESTKVIRSVLLDRVPTKSDYLLNEVLSLEGLSIKVLYSDGTESKMTGESLPLEWLKGFSSEKPFKGKEVIIQPLDASAEVKVSFKVDILPLRVEENVVVEVLESDFNTLLVPEGIKSIQDEAFGNNISLEEIVFPSTLESIGTYSFYASNLRKVDFSKSVLNELPTGTFESCKSLEQVVLPKTLKKIGGNVFYGTAVLKEIEIPDGVEEIGTAAFSNSGIVRVKLPNSIRTIRRSFYKCNELKEVITYGMNYNGKDLERSIYGESFQHCPNLEMLQIPGGVNRIGVSVLGACKVTVLEIPANVEHIEFNAFANASSIEKVLLLGDKKKIIEENAFPSSVMNDVVRQNEGLQ